MKKLFFKSPSRIILFSIVATIVIGTFLLALPWATTEPHSLIDLFFTATSATCVTGLQTIPLSHFTLFGQCIILLLIQIGGLGLITLTFAMIAFFTDLDLQKQLTIRRVLDVESWKQCKNVLHFIVYCTILVEIIGTFLFYIMLKYKYHLANPLFSALFHTISSFTNSGFVVFETGLASFQKDTVFLTITALLIVLGSFGFITLYELYSRFFIRRRRISLQTKIVLLITPCIIAIAALFFFMLEPNNPVTGSYWYSFVHALFNAISCRNTGMTTFVISNLQNATLFLILLISFIGGAPGSSGSGIKVTTFAIYLATIRALLKRKMRVSIAEREIPQDQILQAFSLIMIGLSSIVTVLFALLLIEKELPFFTLAFEVISAFATLGISLGITAGLSALSKLLIIISMFMGRTGSLTLLFALRTHRASADFHYPEERMMIS